MGTLLSYWYNNNHSYSGLNLMTPAHVHYGEAIVLQQQRQAVMARSSQAHRERFMQGLFIVKVDPTVVYINPPKPAETLS